MLIACACTELTGELDTYAAMGNAHTANNLEADMRDLELKCGDSWVVYARADDVDPTDPRRKVRDSETSLFTMQPGPELTILCRSRGAETVEGDQEPKNGSASWDISRSR